MNEFDRQCAEIQAHHQLVADYQKTMALLRALKAGQITLDKIAMREDGSGWLVVNVLIDPGEKDEEAYLDHLRKLAAEVIEADVEASIDQL